jgi:hypothetical protein
MRKPYADPGTLAGIAVVIAVAVAMFLLTLGMRAHAHWRPEYAQMNPLEQQWWKDQHNPTTKINCCSNADGTYAEEDIRDGHYWTKFKYRVSGDSGAEVEKTSDWMEVPTDTILDTTPNIHGAPAVWWGVNYPTGGTPTPFIRCFAPGAKG